MPETPYRIPDELVEQAQRELAGATADELAHGTALYDAYKGATGGRSAVTGAPLPPLELCPALVRYGWLCSARRSRELPGEGRVQV